MTTRIYLTDPSRRTSPKIGSCVIFRGREWTIDEIRYGSPNPLEYGRFYTLIAGGKEITDVHESYLELVKP